MTKESTGLPPEPQAAPAPCYECRKGTLERRFHVTFSIRNRGELAQFPLVVLTCTACGSTFPKAEEDEYIRKGARQWYRDNAPRIFVDLVESIRTTHHVHELDVARLLGLSRECLKRIQRGQAVPSERVLRLAHYACDCPAYTKKMLDHLGIVSALALEEQEAPGTESSTEGEVMT